MQRNAPAILREAEFGKNAALYWMLTISFALAATCIGLPVALIFLLAGKSLMERYLRSLSCVLTTKTLEVKKGIFFKVEKTIPLDKVTDLGHAQGPLMRMLGVEALTVETAGHSSAGALVQMIGVIDTRGFRDAVLDQRDRLVEARSSGNKVAPTEPETATGNAATTLEEIRDGLQRVEELLKEGLRRERP